MPDRLDDRSRRQSAHRAKRAGEGFLLPIGDYKGTLVVIIGLLAGTLNQAAFGRESWISSSIRRRHQHRPIDFWPCEFDAFCPVEVFKRSVDTAVRAIRESQSVARRRTCLASRGAKP